MNRTSDSLLKHSRTWSLVAFVFSLFFGGVCELRAQLQDNFTNRVTLTGSAAHITGNNSLATVEAGEPLHGGKTGGHSLWISWVAPANGIAKVTTLGSGFDTLLAVYRSTNSSPANFDELISFAGADDSEGLQLESEVEFAALAGQRYEIAVDGYFGAVGPLELGVNFDETSFVPPVILNVPPSQAVRLGDPITLTLNVTNIGSADFKWSRNGVEIATGTNLTIASMSPSDVGRYKVKVVLKQSASYFSMPTELQINTEGITTAMAQGKILDSPSTPLIGSSGVSGSIRPRAPTGVVRGYTGSQIFNTTYAVVDPTEPAHCGVSGGSSYWLIYQPPANGTITLDTVGSSYDTVVQAYTYNGAMNSYADLIPIQCDNNSVGSNGAARISFPAVKTRQYVVAVEGVAGASGTGYLNYNLNTNQVPQPPTLAAPLSDTIVKPGTPVSLNPTVVGCPPLMFVWKKNNSMITNGPIPAINFPSVYTNDAGSYSFVVTNDLGAVSGTLPLRVVVPPALSFAFGSGLTLNIPTIANQSYIVEEATNVSGPWQPWPTNFVGDGQTLQVNVSGSDNRFYRVRVQ